ncbi:MAG: TolA-binding protein [Candidatus Latescibacterota bacterium]|jgi:TolA-binding protein
MYLLRYLSVCTLLWLFSGCGEENPQELLVAAEKAAADQATLDQAVEHYNAFLQRFAQHEKAPVAVKQLAAIAQQKGDMQGAITLYERLLAEYPKSEHGDEAQFMIAFIYEEYLSDAVKARSAYQLVIDRYPNSELAASAKQLLPNVGRDPEEWVHFQEKAN